MVTRADSLPPRNAAQVVLRALGVKGPALARAGRVSTPTGYRWLAGDGRPDPAASARIAEVWPQIDPDLWFAAPPGVEPTPSELARDVRARKRARTRQLGQPTIGDEPAPRSIEEAAREARGRVMTAAEKHAATSLLLRSLEAKIEDAIDSLTNYERITAHAGFRKMRRHLLSILKCDPALHQQMLVVLPEPDPEGTAAQLRAIRTELESISEQKRNEAQHFMSYGAYAEANKIDRQRRDVERLLEQARLTAVPMPKLLALKAWAAISGVAAHVLRENREALEVCREELEESNEPFSHAMAEVFRGTSAIVWPCERYQKDILGFFREILGIAPYDKQAEALLLVQDNDWSAIKSGHRTGKSLNLCGVGLWFFCSFPEARVFVTAPTERQLIEIDWRELRMRHAASGLCVACVAKNKTLPPHLQTAAPCEHSAKVGGDLKEKPKGGLHSEDFRQLTGFTARDAESVQGLAGRNVLFLVEEASGVKRSTFVAIKGNLAGGGGKDSGATAKIALWGNPTRNEGEFFDAFHGKKKVEGEGFYATMTISSWDSPNVKADRVVVPGLATRSWCEDRRIEWGENSAEYKIRVLGEFALEQDGKLFSVKIVSDSEERWQLEDADDSGPLYIGYDPAGEVGANDEHGFAPRRSKRILEVYALRGLDEDAALGEILQIIARWGKRGEVATVNVDYEGVGVRYVARLQAYAASNPNVLRVFGIRSSSAAYTEPHVYHTERDELSGLFARWVREGGAIPTDVKLAREMALHDMSMKLTARGEKLKVTPKDFIIRELKRSPDRYDACALSCVEQGPVEEVTEKPAEAAGGRIAGGALDPHADSPMDPYA